MINKWNIKSYLEKTYGLADVSAVGKDITDIKSLLQENYGGALDCTLTSITCALWYFYPDLSDTQIYDAVEKAAKKYFYEESKSGTNPLFINCIINKAAQYLNINVKSGSFYFKFNDYTFNKICRCINENKPVVLNISWDGNNYYTNHSVLIIGYCQFKDKKFLKIYDNWGKEVRYIDYQKLHFLSSFNYVDGKY